MAHLESGREVLFEIGFSRSRQSNFDIYIGKTVHQSSELVNEAILEQGSPDLSHNLHLLGDGLMMHASSLLVAVRKHVREASGEGEAVRNQAVEELDVPKQKSMLNIVVEIMLKNRANMIIQAELRVTGQVLGEMCGFDVFGVAEVVLAPAQVILLLCI